MLGEHLRHCKVQNNLSVSFQLPHVHITFHLSQQVFNFWISLPRKDQWHAATINQILLMHINQSVSQPTTHYIYHVFWRSYEFYSCRLDFWSFSWVPISPCYRIIAEVVWYLKYKTTTATYSAVQIHSAIIRVCIASSLITISLSVLNIKILIVITNFAKKNWWNFLMFSLITPYLLFA